MREAVSGEEGGGHSYALKDPSGIPDCSNIGSSGKVGAHELLARGISRVHDGSSGEGVGLWGLLDLDPPEEQGSLEGVGDEQVVVPGEIDAMVAGLGVPVAGDSASGEGRLHLTEKGKNAAGHVIGYRGEKLLMHAILAIEGLKEANKQAKTGGFWAGPGEPVD